MHSRNWFWRYSVMWHTPSEKACVFGPVHILFLDLKTYSVWPLNFSLRKTSFSIPSVPLQWLSWVLWLFAKDAQPTLNLHHSNHLSALLEYPADYSGSENVTTTWTEATEMSFSSSRLSSFPVPSLSHSCLPPNMYWVTLAYRFPSYFPEKMKAWKAFFQLRVYIQL